MRIVGLGLQPECNPKLLTVLSLAPGSAGRPVPGRAAAALAPAWASPVEGLASAVMQTTLGQNRSERR